VVVVVGDAGDVDSICAIVASEEELLSVEQVRSAVTAGLLEFSWTGENSLTFDCATISATCFASAFVILWFSCRSIKISGFFEARVRNNPSSNSSDSVVARFSREASTYLSGTTYDDVGSHWALDGCTALEGNNDRANIHG
jgi:hypothetical protein